MITPTDSTENLPTEEGLFPIRTVCAQTGVHPVTLRAWERRYGLIRPRRTPKGHRLYSAEDIELINRVLRLLDQGVPIGQVAQLLEPPDVRPTAAPAEEREGQVWNTYRMRLRDGIAALDVAAMLDTWEDALSLFTLDAVLYRLALPVQRNLLARPASDALAGAELAFFTRWLRQTLDARLRQLRPRPQARRVIAAPLHESPGDLGLIRFALASARLGIHVHLLNPGVSPDGLVGLAQRSGAQAIVLYSDSNARQAGRLTRWPDPADPPVYVLGLGMATLPPALRRIEIRTLGVDPEKAAEWLQDGLLQA